MPELMHGAQHAPGGTPAASWALCGLCITHHSQGVDGPTAGGGAVSTGGAGSSGSGAGCLAGFLAAVIVPGGP